ncbi:hypothetical protein PCL_05680 [Purpureocillium lilacinum]|uniref:Uncharacterized protein n=1 Tax=Purpureocillium lilacinum TaxID=33203 RepID=A0A2U3EKL7_PURLI|nr:hypothetical protein PCL_05680 [Purpureocillium lilacinum]
MHIATGRLGQAGGECGSAVAASHSRGAGCGGGGGNLEAACGGPQAPSQSGNRLPSSQQVNEVVPAAQATLPSRGGPGNAVEASQSAPPARVTTRLRGPFGASPTSQTSGTMRTRRHSSVPAAVGTLCNDDAEWLAAVAQLTAPMPPKAPDAGPRGVRRFAHRRIQSASHGCSRFTLFGIRFAARPSDGASEPRSHRGATGEARQNTRLGARQADSQAPRRCARAGGKETNRTFHVATDVTGAKAASGGGRGKGARTQWSPGDPEAPRQVPRCQTGGCRPSSLAGSLRRAPRLPFAAPRFGTPLPWGADHPSIPGSSGHGSPASTEPGGAPAVETLHPHWTALHGNARQSPTPPPPNSAASIHPSIHPSHHHHARRHHGVRGGTEPGA